VKELTDGVRVAETEALAELVREIAHLDERLRDAPVANRGALLAEDLVGRSLPAGVEEEQRAMETLERGRRTDHGLDPDTAAAGQELDEVEPTEGGGVLVLAADRLAEDLDLDPRGVLRELKRGLVDPLECVQRVQEPDGDRARGTEARALRGDVCERHDVDAARNAGEPHRLTDELVLDGRGVLDDLRA
jgi:hypothetical protein